MHCPTQQHRKLEDALQSLQSALNNWHYCYQEVQLGQPLVHGTAPVNSQMIDHLSRLVAQKSAPISLPPGLASRAGSNPAMPSPPSSLGSPNVNKTDEPWYIPVSSQFLVKAEPAQSEPQKMLPPEPTEKRTEGPEDVYAAGNAETGTLRTHLQELLKFPASEILIVRKINRLGFDSAKVLKQHFSLYGTVVEVYVAHSRVKPANCRQSQARWRPSGLGFVVMGCAEEVAAVLKQGAEQDVRGCAIRVQNFERSAAMKSVDEADEKQPAVPRPCKEFEEDKRAESRLVGA